MKILLVSFVYPLIEEYLPDFFNSLNSQSIKCFDKLIFKDNFDKSLDIYGYFGETMSNDEKLSVIQVRLFIINYALKNKYDLLIFCDADDIMADDRIEKIVKTYEQTQGKYGFYYNNLFLLEEKIDFYQGKLMDEVTNVSQIEKNNFLGMSHTAINLKITKNIWSEFEVNDEIIAFDWYMHSYVLNKGFKGKRVETTTYYRIYENNIAGNTNLLTEKKLDVGIRVKKAHYKIMKNIQGNFSVLYSKVEDLEKKLENQEFKEKYIKAINEKFSTSVFWWENIKTLDEIGGIY